MKKNSFTPGKTYIPVSGKIYGSEEINNIIEVARKGWWTEGEYAQKFCKEFTKFLDVKYVALTNSGSSANLLVVAALTADIFKSRKLQKGDEFITTALSFPTTVNPGIIYGLKPVFVDIKLSTLNIDVDQIEKAISKKTKLIMVAHTLGIPFDLEKILYLKKKYDLWLIEDCCDALGSKFADKFIGTFGDMATFSFYPAHHITMAEGGAVVTNNPLLYRVIKQFRDWGRDCWCDTGKDDTCGKRFNWHLGKLPQGYDHKYTYSQIGFNLKLTDFQAAIGVAQLSRLSGFIKKRKQNYRYLIKAFQQYNKYFYYPKPLKLASISWFGFPMIIKPNDLFDRAKFVNYLERHHIGTRPVFAGNMLKHPAYENIVHLISGKLTNCDLVLTHGLWIGLYPGIDVQRLNYIKNTVDKFFADYS